MKLGKLTIGRAWIAKGVEADGFPLELNICAPTEESALAHARSHPAFQYGYVFRVVRQPNCLAILTPRKWRALDLARWPVIPSRWPWNGAA